MTAVPATPDGGAADGGRVTAIVGGALVALTVVAALYFRHHPGPIFLDRWGFSFVHPHPKDRIYKWVTELGSAAVLVAGSILAAVVVVSRDRARALACLVAPGLAVVLVEWLLKPVIARRYAQVLSFPSGTTTAVASLATAWVLAVPDRIRPVAVAIGAFLVGLVSIAVIGLQWHFPTDALGGVVFGAGVVLLVDGLCHLGAASLREPGGPSASAEGTRHHVAPSDDVDAPHPAPA